MRANQVRSLSDEVAMNELATWMKKNDPDLTGDLPGWVWNLVTLIYDLVEETGRTY